MTREECSKNEMMETSWSSCPKGLHSVDDDVHFCEQGNVEDGIAHFIWNPDKLSVEFLVSTEWRGGRLERQWFDSIALNG